MHNRTLVEIGEAALWVSVGICIETWEGAREEAHMNTANFKYTARDKAKAIARRYDPGSREPCRDADVALLAMHYVEVLGELEDIHAKLVELSTRLSDDAEDVQALADYMTRFNT